MNTKISFSILSIFLIILFSTCSNTSIENIDFNSTDTKMYFIDISSDYGSIDSCDFIEKYKNFYIDDVAILELFKNELKKNRFYDRFTSTSCYYGLQLIQDGAIKYGAYLDVKNKLLLESEYYNFDLEKFESYSYGFKKLDSYKITCNSLNDIKKIVSELQSRSIYIFENEYFKEKGILDYNGAISLNYLSSDFNYIEEWSDIEKKIKKSFSKIDNVQVLTYSNVSVDTVDLVLLCNKDISKELPEGYQVSEAYSDSVSLSFRVYDFSLTELKKVLEKFNINNIEMVDLNK